MKLTKEDSVKIKFIQSLNEEAYTLHYTYNRIDEVQEIVRGNYLLPTKDTPNPIKVGNIEFILFYAKRTGVIADFICKKNNDGLFELYVMSLKACNEYERYMSDLMTA